MGDEENRLRRSERTKGKRPARFDDFETDEPAEKVSRVEDTMEEENLNQTVREVQTENGDNPDLLAQMKTLIDNMAQQISISMDSMEAKIEDSRVSVQNILTTNMNDVDARVNRIQSLVETSFQSVNERLANLEEDRANIASGTAKTASANNRHINTTTTMSQGATESSTNSPRSEVPLANDGLVRQLSQTLSDLNSRRKLIDLPKFSGEPEEWPQFIAQYRSTTERENYSTIENNIRLGNSLCGRAKELVKSLLIHHTNVPVILDRLEPRFGLPQHLVESQMTAIRRFEVINENNLTKIVPFADQVMNLRNFLENAGCAEYLNSPSLLKELTLKLPYRERITWTHFSRELSLPTLKEFSDWLITLADDIHCTMIDDPHEKKKRERHSVLHVANVKPDSCKCCSQDHQLEQCLKFEKMTYEERMQFTRSNGICFCCLGQGHIIARCPDKKKCVVKWCKKIHHNLLHPVKTTERKLNPNADSFEPAPGSSKDTQPPPEIAPMEPQSAAGAAYCGLASHNIRVWFKIVPVTVSGPAGSVDVFALFDEGSAVTLMSNEVAMKICASGAKSNLILKWLDNGSKRIDTMVSQIKIAGTFKNAKQFDLKDVHIIEKMSLPQQSLKLDELPTKYHHLKKLPIQEFTNAEPSILIGLNNSHLGRVRSTIHKGSDGPIPILTKLGYVVYGVLNQSMEEPTSTSSILLTDTSKEDIDQVIANYLSTEDFGVKNLPPLESEEILKAKETLKMTTTRVGERYQSRLLWRKPVVNLPNSFPMAVNRFHSIEKKMLKDPSYAELYRATIEDYLKKGYAKKLSSSEIRTPKGPVWYLPHFGVKNPSKPKKFRLVFDAAAAVKNTSLNSELLSGPDVNQPLIKVLSLFRERRIGVCADVKEMYHQILIKPEDRDAQRFVWRSNPDEPLQILRMEVMTFGSTSSPATAQYIKNLNSEIFEDESPEASKAVRENHYVDDYVHCFSSEEEAIQISLEVKKIHRHGGFELRNFISNSEVVTRGLNENESTVDSCLNLDVGSSVTNVDKILGLFWNFLEDEFTFEFKFHRIDDGIMNLERMPTKREFVSIIMSVFDPFGFLSNFTVHMKVTFHKLWKKGIGWDDVIPREFCKEWSMWLSELKNVNHFRIPRCIGKQLFDSSIEWHTFVDASEVAFAAVSYVRLTNKFGETSVSYICGKSKSAPLKQLSIPRMELQAALMGVRILNTMLSCHSFNTDKFVFWSDSKTVLHWIKDNQRRYRQFVSNRVAEIIESTKPEWWFWVPSKDNVADDATKATKIPEFQKANRWLSGPEWLRLGDWPIQPRDLDTVEAETECLNGTSMLLVSISDFPIDVTKYSDVLRLKRHIAWLVRFKRYIISKYRKTDIRKGHITSIELNEAEQDLFRYAQRDKFPEEVNALLQKKTISKSSSLYKSMPYLDEDGILRVYGRIDNSPTLPLFSKRPIILPKSHHITELIVKSYHERYAHQFEELIIAEVRRKFSVSNLRKTVRKIKKNCVECKLSDAKPIQPMMGQLPKERLTPFIRPFSHTGVDFFGPVTVSIGRRQEKRWIALFTCLTIRAVHVEVSENLSSDAFIICLKNFVNLRGVPATLHSDNGSNFIGARTEIIRSKEFFENIKIQDECSNTGIQWKFNSPGDAAAGGCWERLVQSIKRVLKKIMKDVHPRVETLRCFLLEAANIVNSRPLTHIPISSVNEEPLTPNSFLLGCANSIQTPGPLDEKLWCLRKQWRVANCLKNHFWSLWIRDYLPVLIKRDKWCEKADPIKINDVVMICDETVSRNSWQKGIIVDVNMAKDGQTRSAMVKIGSKVLKRPVAKLAVLEIVKSPWTSDLPGEGCH